MISPEEVREAVVNGEIIEHYPEDVRGYSCLISYKKDHHVLHVVCSPKPDYLAIITAYRPNEALWKDNAKVRVKK